MPKRFRLEATTPYVALLLMLLLCLFSVSGFGGNTGVGAARSCLAQLLKRDPATVEVLELVTSEGISTGWAQIGEDPLPARFRIHEVAGTQQVVQLTRPMSDNGSDIGLSAARDAAADVAAAGYLRWGAGMIETDGARLPMGPYLFTWKRFSPDGHETGDYVTLMVDGATGEPCMFVAGYASTAARAVVDEKRAADAAVASLQRPSDPHARYTVKRSRCVLSVPWAGGGPVWFVEIEAENPYGMPDQRLVVVDGTTGEIIAEPVDRFHFPPAPTDRGVSEGPAS